MFRLWHTVQWGSQHFLQDNSGSFCFQWTSHRHQFPEVEGQTSCPHSIAWGQWQQIPCLMLQSSCSSQDNVHTSNCHRCVVAAKGKMEKGWGLSEQEVAELYFQGGHFCSAFLSLIFPICCVTLICPLWCQETSLVSVKFFDAWQLYMKNKMIRACFYLYHFYLDISSCPVLLDSECIQKKKKKINEPMNGTSLIPSWFLSLGFFCQ